MSTVVEKAYAGDFDAICPLLMEHFPRVTRDRLAHLFSPPWPTDEDYIGYKLLDGSRIVGFVACIFSKRTIKGTIRRFCSLSCWVVKKEYRKQALLLLYPALGLSRQGYTITDFTPITSLWQRIGAEILHQHRVVIPVWPNFPFSKKESIRVMVDDPLIENMLNAEHRQIYADHRMPECHHLLLKSASGDAYAVFATRRGRYGMSNAIFYFVSDPGVLLQNIRAVKARIAMSRKAVFLVFDSRFLRGVKPPLFSFKRTAGSVAVVSQCVMARDVDTLYTEMVLLGII